MEAQSIQPESRPNSRHIATKTQVVALHLQGLTNTQIASKLQLSRDTIRKIITESQSGLVEKNTIENIFARNGITSDSIAAKFRDLQNATDVRLASYEGKFTDRVEVPDGNVQFRATEAAAKILGMFPKEDVGASAQLFVRLPDIQLVNGHPSTCLCEQCRRAWEAIPVPSNDPMVDP